MRTNYHQITYITKAINTLLQFNVIDTTTEASV